MISLFDKELMRMEQEVRDLKTAHDIPLGSVNFYSQKVTDSWSDSWLSHIYYYRVTLKAGEPIEPFIEFWFSKTSGQDTDFLNNTATNGWEQNGTMFQFLQNFFDFDTGGGGMATKIVCSSNFDVLFKEYEEGDWIGDLPVEISTQ